MSSSAKFVILLFCSTVVLLYLMFFNQSSTSPWKPWLHFVHVTSSKMREGEELEQKTSEALPREKTTVVQFDIKVKADVKRLILQKNYSKIQDNVSDKSAQQTQAFAMFATRKNLIILSPGRGGSSFLGEIFNSNPRVVYWFEPLHTAICILFNVSALSVKGIASRNYKETSISVMDSLFGCNFSDISHSTLSAFSSSPFRKLSKALTSEYLCPKRECAPFTKPLLSKACNSYNHTVIKILTDRVPNTTIETLEALFQQPNRYDVKLVHLVRDPRAIIYSRVYSVKWIKHHLDPNFRQMVHNICNPILQNLRFGLLNPPPWLKNRFKVIRYEDLALNTANIAQELYRFAGFDWSSSVDKLINKDESQVSKAEAKNPYSLHKNASVVINKWKNAPDDFITTVEDICGDLMKILGYEKWQKAR